MSPEVNRADPYNDRKELLEPVSAPETHNLSSFAACHRPVEFSTISVDRSVDNSLNLRLGLGFWDCLRLRQTFRFTKSQQSNHDIFTSRNAILICCHLVRGISGRSTRFEEHAPDLWNEELEQSQEILRNFLETLPKAEREELIALLGTLCKT
ncbi:hypothetical protein SAMN05216417_108116 [Nitrosospira multiformis]|uniref:Uncharacterized protein n=1 Tax=Nitrosospira multiformis TaxID=1231 RepID=A0A1I7HDN6_9PROT|nr:hypothetical protein SAMN05216417_108116 [Nitrosospira multiformis]